MAETRRNWFGWIVLEAACLCVSTAACAQRDPATRGLLHAIQIQSPQTGSLSGRLTDLHSAPLKGVQVVLRNQATGARVEATTAKNGSFRFASLDAGEYTLEADAPQIGHGLLKGIFVAGGTEARVQAAMQFEPPAPALLEAGAPNQFATPARASPMPLAASLPQPALVTVPLVPLIASASPASAPLRPPVAVLAPMATLLPLAVSIPAEPLQPLPLTAIALLPSASGSALNAASPLLTASVAAKPLQLVPFSALHTEEILRPPAQPETPARTLPPSEASPAASSAPDGTLPPSALEQASHAPAPQQRAALETQSATIQPALAFALPRTLPLQAGIAPDLSDSAAVVNGARVLMRLKLLQLAPILAAAGRVDPVTPAVATTVTATQLQALPVSGRRWQEFLLDTPAAGTSADSSQASFRGSQEPAEITIDGTSTRLAFGAAAGSGPGLRASDPSGEGAENSMGQAWTGGRGLSVSEAAIHEFTTVEGNVEAEGLRPAGGRTSIQTERGGDTLHGQGFLFDRQSAWGAQNPFTRLEQFTGFSGGLLQGFTSNYTSRSYTPPDHEIVWGLGAGSRIRRDKLFWFAALDSYHRNDPGLAAAKEPFGSDETAGTAGYRECYGFFCPPSAAQTGLLCAQQELSTPSPVGPPSCPVAAATLDYAQMLEALDGLLGPAPRTSTQWTGFGRLDWQATERHRFTLEGIGGDWNSPGGGLTQVEETYGSHSFGSSHASEQLVIARWEAYLTPNLLAVTQGSAGRDILTARPDAPSAFEQGFLSVNAYGQLPEIVVDSANGFTIGTPSRFGRGSYPDERLYHGQELVDWVHGHMLVKAGFELDHNADASSLLRNQSGTFHYSHVANFISDALAFDNFGPNPSGRHGNSVGFHNCDQTGKAWYASDGQLMGLGTLPCYSSYSQVIGPTDWHLSTNDWAGFATAQWQPNEFAVFSAGLRWELEQLPPPIAALANPALTSPTHASLTPLLSANLPHLGNNWGPRVSVAIGEAQSHWPVLRLGYGMYYGRTENATIETSLTQTGSSKGDLSFFIRPTDGLSPSAITSGAPQFPDVLTGPPANVVTPGAVGFATNFRNPEVHQAVAAIEQPLPGRVELTASAMLSLGRRLPVYIDTNLGPPVPASSGPSLNEGIIYTVCDEVPYTPPGVTSSGQPTNSGGKCGNLGLGPIKAATITVPFYASQASTGFTSWHNPNFQEIDRITSMANSTYEAGMIKIERYGRHGLSLNAHYTYAHAIDWNPNESPMDPSHFKEEYGTSNLDVRHSAAAMVIYEAPWKLRNFAGHIGNGWMLAGIGQFHSGLPYTMRVTGSLPKEFDSSGNDIVGLRPGINGSGGDNRIYGLGSDGSYYNIGRNTFRYPGTWKADVRLAKRFNLGETREFELLAESFNLFNHQNVTELETTGYSIDPGSPSSESGASGTLPTLTFLTGLKINSKTGLPLPAFGQPLNINGTDFYRERQIQLGLRMRF